MIIPDVFSDIDPIAQSDGPEPACAITYTPEFVEAHNYLRAVLKADERSERAFELTTICLKFNPANYTCWHFRRRCLVALCTPTDDDDAQATIDGDRIEQDLEFAARLGGSNPKNYQLWYHRRALLEIRFAGDEKIQVAQKELDYVDNILDDDNKNYHAWSHRQWIIRTINQPELWLAEIDYSHSKILLDPRNNSAWNQRWFATHEGEIAANNKLGGKLTFDKAAEEANYAVCGAQVDPFNESPWRYLIGVLMEQYRWVQREDGAGDKDKVDGLLREYVAKIKEMNKAWDSPKDDLPAGPCVSLMSALVDLLETIGDKSSLEEAKEMMGELVVEDPVRRKYWQKRQGTVLISLDKVS